MAKATTDICTNCHEANDLSHMGTDYNTDWCFSCNFWSKKVAQKNALLIVDGWIYRPNPPAPTGTPFLGFGGRVFRYRRLTENEWSETNNMSGGGQIPEIWRDQLPDNAEFANVQRVDFPKGGLCTTAWSVTP